MPSFFTPDTLKFLAALEKNNKKAWFDAHKADYERHVKEPSARLAAAAGALLGMEPHVMRIYRDVRFSKDKTPYKSHIGIGFGHDDGMPGVFLHVDAKESAVYGGMWRPEPPQIERIRKAIVAKPAAWKAARKIGLSEDEDALKRPPRGIAPDHPFVEDLKRRSFTAGVPLTSKQVTSEALPRTIGAAAKKLAPLNTFLSDAVRG